MTLTATLARLLRRPDPDDELEDRQAARLDANLAALQVYDPDALTFPAGAFTAARRDTHAEDRLADLVQQYAATKHTKDQMHLYSALFDIEGC